MSRFWRQNYDGFDTKEGVPVVRRKSRVESVPRPHRSTKGRRRWGRSSLTIGYCSRHGKWEASGEEPRLCSRCLVDGYNQKHGTRRKSMDDIIASTTYNVGYGEQRFSGAAELYDACRRASRDFGTSVEARVLVSGGRMKRPTGATEDEAGW